MNYEQKYKEALEKARQFSENPLEEDSSSIVKYIFPELQESEDEKIRKALIRFHRSTINIDGVSGEKIVAWLEKQGNNLVENGYTNNKDIIKYADNYSHEIWRKLMDNFENIKNYHIGCNDVSDIVLNAIIDTYNWLEKQGEKTINQPDFEIPFGAIDSELIEESYYIPKGYHAEISKDKVTIKNGEQKPVEWSEEDEYLLVETVKHLEELIEIDKAKHCGCDVQYYQRDIDWLNSLKQRIGG